MLSSITKNSGFLKIALHFIYYSGGYLQHLSLSNYSDLNENYMVTLLTWLFKCNLNNSYLKTHFNFS